MEAFLSMKHKPSALVAFNDLNAIGADLHGVPPQPFSQRFPTRHNVGWRPSVAPAGAPTKFGRFSGWISQQIQMVHGLHYWSHEEPGGSRVGCRNRGA